ncbi:hypothetical protein F5146DRAFT_1005332 [Armillaria mellea]|nr:hypothetical protein F5146DRAFT_1005332 [Armillaria mellea]
MVLSNFELALALSNLVRSALSSLGSGFIILCYVFLPVKRHYQHLLILNLVIADVHQENLDFINAMTNVISGSVVLATGPLSEMPACITNGFIEQLSVQAETRYAKATDTSILAISIVTISIVTTSHDSSWTAKSEIADVEFISFIALGKGYYTTTSGNWCWLTPEPAYVAFPVHIHRDGALHVPIHLSMKANESPQLAFNAQQVSFKDKSSCKESERDGDEKGVAMTWESDSRLTGFLTGGDISMKAMG